MVGLDPVDDRRLRRRPDRSRGRRPCAPPCSSASCCPPSARISSASRPSNARSATSASWRSRPSGQSSVPPASVPSSHVRVELDRDRPPPRRRSRRAARRPAEHARAGGHDLVEEGGQSARSTRSRSPATAGPVAPTNACAPPRDGGAPPRAGRRSPPDARRAGRGRARTAGTTRRRSCRARASAAPRSADSSVSKMLRRRLWISRSRSKRTASDSPAGSSASIAAEVLAIRRELGQQRLAAPVAQDVVVLVDPEVRGGDRVVAHQPAEAPLDEVVERVVERSLIGRRRRARQRGSAGWRDGQGSSCGWSVPGRSRTGRFGPERTAVRPVWRLARSHPSWAWSRRAPRASRRSRYRCRRRVDAVVGDGPDLPWAYSTISTFRARSASRNAPRSRSTLKSTKFVRTRSGSNRPGVGWAMPPG